MLKTDMVAKNPLRALDQSPDGGLVPGQVGIVAARAGTGKTAFLIQVALDNLFRDNPVLHVSIGDTVTHVKSWYKELYRDLAEGYDLEKAREVWEDTRKHRMIMTFRVQAFTVEKLEERLNDLVEQKIFLPRTVVVDGLDLDEAPQPTLGALAAFARDRDLKVWVATRSHREGTSVIDGVRPLLDHAQVVVALESGEGVTSLTVLKNPGGGSDNAPIQLDPRTLLLKSGR